ncbi:hypothetical protein V5O48_001871 [Marasmius crinis-equi]|uniref:MYND-type domain-containing protein n=1 Tax=Marasmius crinis-equi TaxID=585013 RepID=A0ABR3FXA1_9AGAR
MKKLEATLKIFVALSYHIDKDKTASRHIRPYWQDCLQPWIDFIFRNIILTHQRPTETSSIDYFECSVNNLPVILRLPRDDADWIENATPGLVHALLQSWYLLLDLVHPASVQWEALILSFIRANPNCLPPSTALDPPVLYYENDHLGEIIVEYLTRTIRDIRKKSLHDLHDIHGLLSLITKICMLHKLPPIFMGTNAYRTLHLTAKLCDTLLLAKKKRLRNGKVQSTIYREAHAIIVMCYNIILKGMDQAIRVHYVLTDNFLENMMSVDSRYLHLDHLTPHRDLQFQHISMEILNHISVFLIYPFVLRQFVRISHNLHINRDRFIEARANNLWTAWVNINEKAASFFGIRQEMKERTGLCSYLECHLRQNRTEQYQEIRYLRCLGCECVIYCSHDCRKAHWRKEHSAQCLENATEVKNGRSPAIRDNVQFFAFVLEHHLRLFGDIITDKVKTSAKTFDGYSFNSLSLPAGKRQPFVWVKLDAPNLPEAFSIEVVDQRILNEWARTGYFNSSDWLPSFLEMWGNTEHDEIVTVAAFPRTPTNHWPFVKSVDFPLKDDLRFSYDVESTLST